MRLMEWTDYDSATCSIARSLDVVGDRWTLLLLRDFANGVRRFTELQQHLGVARDVLSRRLSSLVDAGVIERHGYREPGDRARAEYRLSPAGRELQSVLIALMEWGDRHLAGAEGPPMGLEHKGCGAPVHTRLACAEGHEVTERDLLVVPREAARPAR
jgi:DNA-binding HxlR family transcriptional regulator